MKSFQNKVWKILVILAVFLSCSSRLSAKSDESLLYQVSGSNLQNPVYLFGTVHAFPASQFFIEDVVVEKLNKSEQLVMEVDMSNPSIFLEMAQYVMMPDQTLSGLLSKDDYEKANQFFSDSLQMPLVLFANMKPLLVSAMMIPYLIGEEMVSYEEYLTKKATSIGIPVAGLETVKEQMRYIDLIPLEDQARMLMEQISNMDEARIVLQKLIHTYQLGDSQAVYEFMSHYTSEYREFGDYLLAERNENWIPRIIELSSEHSLFVAVGCGHLGGERGLINLFRKMGYKVEAVL